MDPESGLRCYDFLVIISPQFFGHYRIVAYKNGDEIQRGSTYRCLKLW